MKLKLREMIIFALLGVIMFISKLVMEFLPNVHLIGAFTIAFTVVYRRKALYPITIFAILTLIYAGPYMWPYFYVWTVLWGVTMLLPKKMPYAVAAVVYTLVCGLHGLSFGTLYAPAQALMFGLNFEQTLAWISVGFLTADIPHMYGNLLAGTLILPIIRILKIAENKKSVG